MTIFRYLQRVFQEQPMRLLMLMGASIFAGGLEGLGIALLIPALQIIGGGADAEMGRLGSGLKSGFGALGLDLTLGPVLLFIVLVTILQQAAIVIQNKIALGTAFRYEAELRKKLYKSFLDANWLFFVHHKSGRLANVLTTEVSRAKLALTQSVKMVTSLVIAAVYIFLAVLLSWQIALISLAGGALVLALLSKRVSRGRTFGQSITAANAGTQSEIVEKLAGVKLVKGCAAEEEVTNRFNVLVQNLARSQYLGHLNQSLIRASYQLLTVSLLCLTIYIAIAGFQMPMAKLVVFLLVFYRLAPKMSEFQGFQYEFYLQIPAVAAIDELLEGALAAREQHGGLAVGGLTDAVALKNVDFSYTAGRKVLDHVSMEIPRSRTIAIVGGSGGGKSTIVDLLMGLVTPEHGKILVDGRALTTLDLKTWRARIGYVAQDTVLFHDTVEANIGWVAPDASSKEIRKAAAMADAHDFIVEQLPQGYDTVIGDRGARLSGGQRQRLALARALVRQPQLLILDEATSALDASAEKRIQQVIESLAGSLTIVVVTHRLFTVKFADMIYVLENGQVVEAGGWGELVSRQGRFNELQELQKLD